MSSETTKTDHERYSIKLFKIPSSCKTHTLSSIQQIFNTHFVTHFQLWLFPPEIIYTNSNHVLKCRTNNF